MPGKEWAKKQVGFSPYLARHITTAVRFSHRQADRCKSGWCDEPRKRPLESLHACLTMIPRPSNPNNRERSGSHALYSSRLRCQYTTLLHGAFIATHELCYSFRAPPAFNILLFTVQQRNSSIPPGLARHTLTASGVTHTRACRCNSGAISDKRI